MLFIWEPLEFRISSKSGIRKSLLYLRFQRKFHRGTPLSKCFLTCLDFLASNRKNVIKFVIERPRAAKLFSGIFCSFRFFTCLQNFLGGNFIRFPVEKCEVIFICTLRNWKTKIVSQIVTKHPFEIPSEKPFQFQFTY